MDYHGTTRNYVCWDGALALKAATKGLEGAQAPRYFAEVRMTSATKGGNGIMAATTITVLPATIVLVLFQKWLVGGLTKGALKG